MENSENKKKEKKINKMDVVLSIIIAFSAWIYVVYNIDPIMTNTFEDIPVTFTNEEQLENNGLAVKSLDAEKIDVNVQAKRSILDNISKDEIKAEVNLADAGKGKNIMALNITLPGGASVKSQSMKKIEVNVEDRIFKKVDVYAVFDNEKNNKNGREPVVTEKSVDKITVSGAESLVNGIAYAKLPLDHNQVKNREKSFIVSPIPVNEAGNEEKYLSVFPNKVSVKAMNGTTKKVKLKVNIIGEGFDGNYKRTCKFPEYITVKGTKEALEDINQIETQNINLSRTINTQDIFMQFNLPEGVSVANASLGSSVHVEVQKLETATIPLDLKRAEITDLDEDMQATVKTSEIYVTVKAFSVDGISAKDFKMEISAKDLEEGTHTVPVNVICTKKSEKLQLNPESVVLEINSKQ